MNTDSLNPNAAEETLPVRGVKGFRERKCPEWNLPVMYMLMSFKICFRSYFSVSCFYMLGLFRNLDFSQNYEM